MTPEETILFLESSTPNEIYNFFEGGKCKYGFKLNNPGL